MTLLWLPDFFVNTCALPLCDAGLGIQNPDAFAVMQWIGTLAVTMENAAPTALSYGVPFLLAMLGTWFSLWRAYRVERHAPVRTR